MIRPLGHNELYQLARYTLDQYRGTSVTCRYTIPETLRGQDAHDKLVNAIHAAVGHVISGAPTLQVGITGEESSKPVWIQLGTIDLREHVKWLNDSADDGQAVQDAIVAQLDTRFFELKARPGWRVVVLQHTKANVLDILFTWNHPHGDGMSGKIFHQLLLEALRKVAKDSDQQQPPELTLKFSDSSKEFPPCVETVASLPLTPAFLLKEAWNDYKPPSLFPKPTQADWAPIKTLPYKTRFSRFAVPDSILSKVVATCHTHKTTITGLMNGLALLSLAARLNETKAPAFASSTALDLRRFVPSSPPSHPWLEPHRTIANYVSIMYHHFDHQLLADIRAKSSTPTATSSDLSPELLDLLWSTSTRVRREIEKKLEIGLQNDQLGLMRFVPNWRKQFQRDVKRPRKLSWFVTNLGVLDGNAGSSENEVEKDWSIRRAQFSLSTEIPVAALLIGMASVKGGDLVVTCTWQDTVVEDSLAEGVMADLERWLIQIGGL